MSFALPCALAPSLDYVRKRFAKNPSRFMEVEGATVHYRDEGTGPVLLMIHGAGCNLHVWNEWVRILGDKYRIVRFDLPPSPLTRDSHRLTGKRQYELLGMVIEKLGLQRPVLIGNSSGANAAVNYAAKHPDNVAALVLSTVPLFRPRSDQYRNLVRRVIESAHNRFFPNYLPRWYFRFYCNDLFVDKARITPDFIDMYHCSSAAEGVIASKAKYIAALRSQSGQGWSEQEHQNASRVTAPTLIQWGDGNTVLLPQVGDDVAALFHNASVSIIHYKEAAHYPAWEIPEQSSEDLEIFLKQKLGDDAERLGEAE